MLASTSDTGDKANGESFGHAISADGTHVAFSSRATNLDPGDDDDVFDVFMKDLETGEVELVSTSDTGQKGNGESIVHALSADGTKVAFTSDATNLDPDDTDTLSDIYVKDLTTGAITLVSTSEIGEKANNDSFAPDLSADGSRVAFYSLANNLDPADTDSATDVFVRDLGTGDLMLASSTDRGAAGNFASDFMSLSADGSSIAFSSLATNLDADDDDTISDVYVKDLATGDVELVSTSDSGEKSNGYSSRPSLADDGGAVAFTSSATNLDGADTDASLDVYVKDLSTGEITLASASDSGLGADGLSSVPWLSSDGASVTFTSIASNLDPFDFDSTFDVYVKDLPSGEITLASITSAGEDANGYSTDPILSTDATLVVFRSEATNLHPDDDDVDGDIYVKALGGVTAIPTCGGLTATRAGTDGDDTILGTSGNDVIVGFGGRDWIDGLAGHDVLCGGGGDDSLFGYGGADVIFGGAGNDFVNGVGGDDTVHAGLGSDYVVGMKGNDHLFGGPGPDYLKGDRGGDTIGGEQGADTIVGGDGDDVVKGGVGDDVLFGGLSSDVVVGGTGDDSLRGGSGDDTLTGGSQRDALYGGIGVDLCDGGAGTDTGSPGCELELSVP